MSIFRRYPELPQSFRPQDLTSAWGQLIRLLEARDAQPLTPTDVNGEVKYLDANADMKLAYAGASVDASTANVTVDLPKASAIPYKEFFIKKSDSSANTVTLDAEGSETIDGAATLVLSTQNQSRIVKSDGENWIIIGGYL